MREFKRFILLIYIHLTLSVFLTYLGLLSVFNLDPSFTDLQKSVIALAIVSAIYGMIGLFWGLVTPEKKKLLLPVSLYVLVLSGFFTASFFIPAGWLTFLNANIPFTYFTRNITSRTVWTLIIDGASCIVPSFFLYRLFKLGYVLGHRPSKVNPER